MTAFSRAIRITFFVVALLVLFLSCGRESLEAVDPADSPAARLLRDYIRIDTSSPPGNETRGAEWLASKLDSAGIPRQLLGSDASRKSLYARLDSGRDAPALVLMHHIDVVPADEKEWSVDPFGAELRNGYIFGRGAIDAKSLGIAHLLGFLHLAERVEALERDVILLAVADEESGGTAGAGELLERHPELFADVGFVLNEGGGNQVVVDEVIYWGIEVDQKVPLWVEVVATGAGGHGSLMNEDSSILQLLRVLDRVRRIEPRRVVTPSVQAYFESIAGVKKGRKGKVLSDVAPHLLSPELPALLPEAYLGLLQDTWTISVLDAGERVNVVPNRARAEIDIRLTPGSDAGAALARLKELAEGDAEVNVILQGSSAPASPVETPLWDALSSVISAASPEATIGPMVSLGATDSRYFRERGIVAYGFSPYKINYYDGASVHGSDERIRLAFLNEGVELMKAVLDEFCLPPP